MACELFPDMEPSIVEAAFNVGMGCSQGGDTGLSSSVILLAMMEGRVPTIAARFRQLRSCGNSKRLGKYRPVHFSKT